MNGVADDGATVRPELTVQSRWAPFARRTQVTLTPEGLAWGEVGAPLWSQATWDVIGGIQEIVHLGGWAEEVLALDGSVLGSIRTPLQMGGVVVSLCHVVAVYRPDVFVESSDVRHGSMCIRRDVEAFERRSGVRRDGHERTK